MNRFDKFFIEVLYVKSSGSSFFLSRVVISDATGSLPGVSLPPSTSLPLRLSFPSIWKSMNILSPLCWCMFGSASVMKKCFPSRSVWLEFLTAR